MAGTNILVTESFLAANFSPKNGHTRVRIILFI